MHPVQIQLLSLLRKRNGDIEGLSLRDMGELIGVGQKPQIIAHHLRQLELKGYLRRDENSKNYTVLTEPVTDVVYINLYEAAECGPDGMLGNDEVIDKIPLSSRAFGISKADDYFLIKARGKSMEPMIRSGDLVLTKKQTEVENGSVAVVVHKDVPKIKKVIKDSSQGYSLVSLNPEFAKEDIFDAADIRIVGLVKGIIRVSA